MRGGYRVNSGRKRGSLSKKTTEIAQKAVENQTTPLEYLISVYTDINVPRPERMAAAIAACPYMHPKVSSMALNKEPAQQISVDTINIVSIPSGKFLNQTEIEQLSTHTLPVSIEAEPQPAEPEAEVLS